MKKSRYIPNGYELIAKDERFGFEVYATLSPRIVALAYGGKRTNPDWHYRFKDEAALYRQIENTINGFMQSAEANTKGELFNEANKFLREEIRRSNPEYAKYLEKYHKTRTLSDILDATIQRRTGQTQGGFLRT